MKKRLKELAVAMMLWAPMLAMATPYLFTGQATINDYSVTIPGVVAGDTAIIEVIVDNGGNTLISQSWSRANVISATITIAGYFGTFNPPYDDLDPIFVIDSFGNLTRAVFNDLDAGNIDSFGNSPMLFGNAVMSVGATSEYIAGFVQGPAWSVSPARDIPTRVPEPGSLALLGLGLASLLLSRRRMQGLKV